MRQVRTPRRQPRAASALGEGKRGAWQGSEATGEAAGAQSSAASPAGIKIADGEALSAGAAGARASSRRGSERRRQPAPDAALAAPH